MHRNHFVLNRLAVIKFDARLKSKTLVLSKDVWITMTATLTIYIHTNTVYKHM